MKCGMSRPGAPRPPSAQPFGPVINTARASCWTPPCCGSGVGVASPGWAWPRRSPLPGRLTAKIYPGCQERDKPTFPLKKKKIKSGSPRGWWGRAGCSVELRARKKPRSPRNVNPVPVGMLGTGNDAPFRGKGVFGGLSTASTARFAGQSQRLRPTAATRSGNAAIVLPREETSVSAHHRRWPVCVSRLGVHPGARALAGCLAGKT